MNLFLLFVLIFWLCFITIKQSTQTRETKSFLDELKKEINRLTNQIADLKSSVINDSTTPEPDFQVMPPIKEEPIISSVQSEKPEQQKYYRTDVFKDFITDRSPGIPEDKKEPVEIETPVRNQGLVDSFNWENFLGAKMFAWVGGLSLFIGFAFLLKYSFDHDLISPEVRVTAGFLCGIGLVISSFYLKQKTYEITSQTLCATGIVILYASSFAANAVYDFISPAFAFTLMSLITAGAFILSARTNAKVIAVLGIVGGFLTYPILSTGQDQPLALFAYITFLNTGLLCVAIYKKWNFLVLLGVIGTVLTELGWIIVFFTLEKLFIAVTIFLWFDLLFCCANWYGKRIERSDNWLRYSAVSLPFVTFLFALFLVFYQKTGAYPGSVFTCMLGADLCLAAIIMTNRNILKFQIIAGGCVFFVLSMWITARMTPVLLIWALAGSLVFAFIHSAFPMIMAQDNPSSGISRYSHIFPLIALLLTLIPIFKGSGDSFLIWPFTLLINGGIMVLALLTASAWAILGALIVTAIVISGWVFSGTIGGFNSWAIVLLIGVFGAFFSTVATFILNQLKKKFIPGDNTVSESEDLFDFSNPNNIFLQIPVFSTVLPFMLLILASIRTGVDNPVSFFGLGLLLTVIAIWLSRYLRAAILIPITLGSVFLLELVVYLSNFNHAYAHVFLGFYITVTAVFFILPFYFKNDYFETTLPWGAAALSGPIHFCLFYDTVNRIYPNDIMGLLPAVMAVPFFFGLKTLIRWIPKDSTKRTSILAWFGGSTLFFFTLIFPVQFDHQWLTIGWALEGLALIWLFRRIPHPGLHGLGFVLLLVTFLRLGMNPEILKSYPQSEYPVFNWYLYTYGISIICLMSGGRLLVRPDNRVIGINAPPILYTLGTILAFILMNIEIADFFSTGKYLTFHLTGDLAQSMTYSIAWALFALALVVTGILKQLRPVRYSAICLVGVTLIKLFLYDLRQLDQLYRISAFIGVAIVLITASILYQKWVVRKHE